MADKIAFGVRVREAREKKGWGLREFSRLMDLKPTYVYKIEKGEFIPNDDVILRISKKLELPYFTLCALGGRVPPKVEEAISADPTWLKLIWVASKKGRKAKTFLDQIKGEKADE